LSEARRIWTAEDIEREDVTAILSMTLAQRAAVNRIVEAGTHVRYTEAGGLLRLARLRDAEANRRNAPA